MINKKEPFIEVEDRRPVIDVAIAFIKSNTKKNIDNIKK